MADPVSWLVGGGIASSILGAGISAQNAPSFPQPPKLPDPPKMEDMIDVIDKITGVQSITVTGADGKKRRVTERLPRTPEEEKVYQEAGVLMRDIVGNIQQIYANNPNMVLDYLPLINTFNILNVERGADVARLANIPDFNAFAQEFRDMERYAIDEQYRDARNLEQNRLAGMGYGADSTAQSNAMAALDAQRGRDLRGADVRAKLAGQEYGEKEIRNRALAYTLSEEGRRGVKQGQLDVLGAHQGIINDRQRQLADQTGLLQSAAALRKEDVNTALASHAPQLGVNLFNTQLNAHRALIDTRQANYNNMLNAYQMRPLNFGEAIGGVGAGLGGYAFGKGLDDILNAKSTTKQAKQIIA